MNSLRVLFTAFCIILLSTTTFAYSLSDFPVPFIQNGIAAPNLVIVVGDDSAASDVFGAIDVALALQSEVTKVSTLAQEKEEFQGTTSTEFASIKRGSHPLGVNDYLGNLRESLTEIDLDMLKGGQIATSQAATQYNQYLKFQNTTGQITFDIDERGNVQDYLTFQSGDQIFEWQLEFERGLASKIDGNDLTDINDKDIFVLGQPMVIADTDFTETTGRLMIKLMSGALSAIMGENDRQTYKIGNKEYDVEVVGLSTTANSGQGSVKFRINGVLTDEMRRGSIVPLQDGTYLGIRNIMPSEKSIQKSLVQLYLGANYILLEDKNIEDKLNTTAGATINGKTVTTATVRIEGKVLVANKTVEINSLHYSLSAEPLFGELRIPAGQGLRSQLKIPQGMLTPNWDINYEGLSKTGQTTIALKPSSETKYKLDFINQEGIHYDFSLLNAQNNCLRYGDETNDLWFIESNSPTTYYATAGDFFVLSKCNPSANKNTCNTHIIKYRTADTSSALQGLLKLAFTDLGIGNKDTTLTLNSGRYQGIISAGDGEFAVNANTINNIDGTVNISVDLNGDGAFNNGEAIIGTKAEALLDLGATNTNESNQEGRNAYICTNPAITLRTLSKQFDKAEGDEVIPMTIEARSGNTIGMQTPISATAGYFSGLKYVARNTYEALSGYGIFFEFYEPGARAETMTIYYPKGQRGADVLIGKPAVAIDAEEQSAETAMQSIQKTQLGSIVKLASEIENIRDYNSIIIGGSCVNKIAAELQNNPQPCWQSIALGIGLISAYEFSNGNIALLVAGRAAKDTKRATTALANKMLENVQSAQARITQTTDKKIKIVGV